MGPGHRAPPTGCSSPCWASLTQNQEGDEGGIEGPESRRTMGETKSWRERNGQAQLEACQRSSPPTPAPAWAFWTTGSRIHSPSLLTALWPLSKAPSHWAWALGSAKPWLHSLLRKGVINHRHTRLPHLQNGSHCQYSVGFLEEPRHWTQNIWPVEDARPGAGRSQSPGGHRFHVPETAEGKHHGLLFDQQVPASKTRSKPNSAFAHKLTVLTVGLSHPPVSERTEML